MTIFTDRSDAGKRLAAALLGYAGRKDAIVFFERASRFPGAGAGS
jgi:predicted phosphoribosyltransferase